MPSDSEKHLLQTTDIMQSDAARGKNKKLANGCEELQATTPCA
jgi:hypothetical protein